jgi:hypothetical protein
MSESWRGVEMFFRTVARNRNRNEKGKFMAELSEENRLGI